MATSLDFRIDTFTLEGGFTPSFTVTPSTRQTFPNTICNPFTITLSWTPSSNEVFSLSDNGAGGTLYNASVTVLAGSTTATFSYLHAAPGTYTITVTDVTSGLGSQDVTVYMSQSPGDDIRVYSPTGGRMALPENAIYEMDFEVLEMGGYGRGTLKILAQWDDTQATFTGGERVDAYYRGELVFRGYLWEADRSGDDSGEYHDPQFYGLMQRLERLYCDRKYVYAAPQDLSVFAQAIINDYINVTDGVTTSYRIPSPPLPDDLTTDIDTVGVTLTQFDARGMTVAQALTALCDTVPYTAQWGFGVDGTSPVPLDVLYFRPRPTTTEYRTSIGGDLSAWQHSSDMTGIVNRLRVTGGKVSQPNLVTDGSFEDPAPASELVGNYLEDYSFETGTPWTASGGATRKSENPHTGTYSYELDTNGETVETTSFINIPYLQPFVLSCWGRCEAGTGPHYLEMAVDGYTSGGVLVVSILVVTSFSSTSYARRTLDVDFSAYATVAKVKVRFSTDSDVSVGDGVNIDDVGLYEKDGIANGSWRYALTGAAVRDYVKWNHREYFNPWHGAYATKAKVSAIAGSGDYLEIRTDPKVRLRLKPSTAYTMLFRYKDVDAADYIKAAVYEYKADGTSAATSVSAAGSNASAQWNTYVYAFTSNANTVEAEIAIRLTGNTDAVIDGVMVIEGALPADAYLLISDPDDAADTSSPFYYEGDRYEATIATSDYRLDLAALTGGTVLSADAGTSIDDYGVMEGTISLDGVVDELSLLTFAAAWFNVHAVPVLRGTVTVLDPNELIKPDGKVRLINLRFPPDPLFPSKCHTTFGQDGYVRQEVDLGNEQPDMVEFLRLTEKRARERFGE